MKILHIEDVPEISQIFADILTTKNFDFDRICDGESKLELAGYKDYDLFYLMCACQNTVGLVFF